jgi:hypothetical protein
MVPDGEKARRLLNETIRLARKNRFLTEVR